MKHGDHVDSFGKALRCLERAFVQPKRNRLQRVGFVKLYELAYWQAWQVLRDRLNEEGVPAFGPEDSIRKALELGLIGNAPVWMEMLSAEERFMGYFLDDELEHAVDGIGLRYLPELRSVAGLNEPRGAIA